MMAEQERVDLDKKQSHISARIVLLITVLAFLLGLGTASVWRLFWSEEDGATGSGLTALLAPAKEKETFASMVELGEFVVNIISEYEPRYARLSLALALDRENTQSEITKRMPQIRDTIVLLINGKTFEELQDQQGKLQIKAELKSAINAFLTTGQVNEVYLTDFVVQ